LNVTSKSFLIGLPAGCPALRAEYVNPVSRRSDSGHEYAFSTGSTNVCSRAFFRHRISRAVNFSHYTTVGVAEGGER
jgi:hypothetical protein